VTRTQYYTATTLDGFIADPDKSLSWLFTRKQEQDGPLSYGAFIADVGAIAMGSTTYEWILDHEFSRKDIADWQWVYDVPCWSSPTGSCPSCPTLRSSS
jgi:dihydrofolate reductase